MIAIVTGGTGLTGMSLLNKLTQDTDITQIISVSRRSSEIKHPKLKEVLLPDLDQLPSIVAQLTGDLYFCCLGTTAKIAKTQKNFEKVDHDAVVAFGAIAKLYNAKSFTLVSSGGAQASSMVFYLRVKGQTENDLKSLGLRSLVIFQPALLVGDRREFRLSEKIAHATLVPISRLLPTRLRKRLISEIDILSSRMIEEAKAAKSGISVIVAKDI